jgi:hypothetical protein
MSSPLVSVTLSLSGAAAAPLHFRRDASSLAAESTDATPFSFLATGRHDGGALPPECPHPHYSLLLDALGEAKAAIDGELTSHAAAAAAAVAPPAMQRWEPQEDAAGGAAPKKPRTGAEHKELNR